MGSRVLVWCGVGLVSVVKNGSLYAALNNGGVYDRMIVWGGFQQGPVQLPQQGFVYDPAADTWTPMNGDDSPPGTPHPILLRTGSRAIVVGGAQDPKRVKLCDWVSDAWQDASITGSPFENGSTFSPTIGAWDGCRAILWDDGDPEAPPVGWAYEPPQ